MAPRCSKTTELEVHHINTDLSEENGLNEIGNAIVLCRECHDVIHENKKSPLGNPDFIESVKKLALYNANYQCQCLKEDCHEGVAIIRRILSRVESKKS